MKKLSVEELKKKANDVRIDVIKMTTAAKSGHPGGSMSATDFLTALYFNILNHNPKMPDWEERDRFVLSNAHICPVLYALMAETGYFPKEELMTLRKFGTRLQGHPGKDKLPYIETSGGSLGQGLSIAAGMALGLKSDKKDQKVFCGMGDGELQEGSIWESAMAASQFKLGNLIGMLDRNFLQIMGKTEKVMALDSVKEKFEAFGWHTIEAEGHDMQEILDAYEEAIKETEKPSVIIFKTVMGKGVSFMENKEMYHGMPLKPEDAEKALKELGA